MMTYEVVIRGGELDLQEMVARVLCPVEGHAGPCEVPWGFSVSGDDDLVLGIYASPAKATEVVERVQEVVGGREVVLTPAPADHFEELEEQYRIEHGG
ncbi:hypothetical protein ACIBL3_20115 [Kribbella sp. NPDC050124]|uniref:hypothetical protein n=1 Tax=Kribbella sp. NPDC050124 TaxID=3364114 RepID=UPI0037A53F15